MRRALGPLLLVAFVSSIIHYTDNAVRLERYSPGAPSSEAWVILASWFVFAGFAAAGLLLKRRGERVRPAVFLLIASMGVLISPLHYVVARGSSYDLVQHTFIWTDFAVGVAVATFAVRMLRPAHSPTA